MARAVRQPRHTRTAAAPKRSVSGRVAAAALGIASAVGVGAGLNQTSTAIPTTHLAMILPDPLRTPGAVDPTVSQADICRNDWAPATSPGTPPHQGGTLTYSQAARHTSQSVKEKAFAEYGLQDPHDNGQSYEVDHKIPLALGGRDVIENLWPQSRTAPGWNAWVKDRLEFRLYSLVCHRKAGDPQVSLAEIQRDLEGDWTKAFAKYCAVDEDCPNFSGKDDDGGAAAGKSM